VLGYCLANNEKGVKKKFEYKADYNRHNTINLIRRPSGYYKGANQKMKDLIKQGVTLTTKQNDSETTEIQSYWTCDGFGGDS